MKGNDFEMNRKIKQILSLLLAAVIFVGVMPMSTVPASAATRLTSSQIKNYVESRVGQTYTKNACLAFVKECFVNLGGPQSTSCCAYNYGNSFIVSTSKDNIPIGADVFFGNKNIKCGSCGNYCGHIGIYVGNGKMVHASGGEILKTDLNYVSNYRGWGYHGGINIVDVEDTTAPLYAYISADKLNYNIDEPVRFSFNTDASPNCNSLWIYCPNGEILSYANLGNSFELAFGMAGYYEGLVQAWNGYGNKCSEKISWYVGKPQYSYITVNKKKYDTNENIQFTFNTAARADYNTIWIYKPDGSSEYHQRVGNSFNISFSQPGSYEALVEAWNDIGSCVSEKVSFVVGKYEIKYDIPAYENQIKYFNETLKLTTAKPTGKSFTVNYNANGGSVSASGKTVSQTFTNWNTAKNGSGKTYLPGATYSDNANLTLYAQYSNPSVGTLPTPTRSGYTFDGWYTAKDGGTKVSESLKVTANITLYAHWTKIEQHIPTVKSVKIDDNAEINYKSSYKISSEITAESGAEYTAEWQSSNPKVASVDKNGKVTALKKGTAKITCTVTDSYGNTVSDTCNVTVKYSFGQWLIIILLFGWIWYI